jgi:ribose transport system ATP-binding protein
VLGDVESPDTRAGRSAAGTRIAAPPVVAVHGLAKAFGGVQALSAIDLDVGAGEVHGLVGENGAGKSTLIRMLAGIHQPDAGTIEVDGQPVEIRDPQAAASLGLSFIHQELSLVPRFGALENMTLGMPKPTRLGGLIDWAALRRQAAEAAERVGITFSLDTPVDRLSVGEQWLVSIARALVQRSRLIAMDEPTASLTEQEAERLFRIVEELSRDGIAIMYVSHRLEEILRLCRRVTVFRDGTKVGTIDGPTATRAQLIEAIVGHNVELRRPAPVGQSAEPVLEARNLRRAPLVHDVSLRVAPGEILGLAGLMGAGRSETARLIFGAERPEAGEVLLDGRPVKFAGPHEAIKRGIALVPEERRSQGLVLERSVAFNYGLPNLPDLRRLRALPFVSAGREADRAREMVERLSVKTASVRTPVGRLSGGNQQKVLIGRWLVERTKVLILDEPSRGVDIGARAEIHAAIARLAAEGMAVLVISSEVEELVAVCHRVTVLVEGRVSGELEGDDINPESILRLCYAHESTKTERSADA